MMKNRKNCLIPAMLLALALVLTGCGSDQPQGGQVTPATEAAQIAETTLTAETEAAEAPVRIGRMEGGTYTNTYAGFGCDLDESWIFYSAEELQEIPDSVKDAVEGSTIGDAMQNMEQFADMMAENADLLTNINVLYTKQDMTARLAMMPLSEEKIMDLTLEDRDEMIAGYAEAGLNVSSLEKVQVPFLGETRWGLKTVAETEGIPCYIVQVFDFKQGAYGVTLTVTSFMEDNTQAALDLFYAVN